MSREREDAGVVEVGAGQVSRPAPFVLRRTLTRTTIDADILCGDGSIPRSAIVYAQEVDDRSFRRESTYQRVDGHLRLRVMVGLPYDVHGEVLVPDRDATGREIGVRSVRTPVVRVESRTPRAVVQLVAPLERCQEATVDGPRKR